MKTNYNKILTNPNIKHYNYIMDSSRRFHYYGEEGNFTLLAPLFQSFNTDLLWTLITSWADPNNQGILKEELEKAENGEMMDRNIFETADYINYTILQIQYTTPTILVVDQETGAINKKIDLTPNNLEKTIEEIFPEIYSINQPQFIFSFPYPDPSPFDSSTEDPSPRGEESSQEEEDDEKDYLVFGGFFPESKRNPGVTYTKGDVREHHPPFQGVWSDHQLNPFKTGWIIDMDTRKVLDIFYGICNDFNEWFLSYVWQGKRFEVYIDRHKENEPPFKADYVGAFINHDSVYFYCDNGCWTIEDTPNRISA